MAAPAMDHAASVDRFCGQVLQLEREPAFPAGRLLREDGVQAVLYRRLFDGALAHPPPPRYQLRVLKALVARIEEAIEDWDLHVRS